MITRDFDAITKDDVDGLIANVVPEGRTIEYKQQLPSGTDDDKREFLADVSSFANAGGGDVLYGIVEKRDVANKPTGIPEKSEGLPSVNTDAEIRRLDQLIRSSIDPRIPGYRIRGIDGFPAGPIILIRIPKSWASPHMVTFKNLSRFFSRTSAGKYQLDVREIRSASTASVDLHAKITAFRSDRLAKVIANEAPIRLYQAPILILHLVPLTALDTSTQVDLSILQNDPDLAAPMQKSGYDFRFNLDGFLEYGPCHRTDSFAGYTQVFRSGALEAVDASLCNQPDGTKLVPTQLVERTLLHSARKYLATVKQLGVPAPIVVLVTMHGLKGYALATKSPWHNANPSHVIDRETLLLPDVLLEDYATPIDQVMRPVLDAFWQSAGFGSCENYDLQGRWDGGASKLGIP